MTPATLSRTVLNAVRCAVAEGELSVAVPARVVVERPRAGGCGDYATGIALQLARPARRSAQHVADVLKRRLLAAPGVAGVEITGPGFLNITLDGRQWVASLVRDILRGGAVYGHLAVAQRCASSQSCDRMSVCRNDRIPLRRDPGRQDPDPDPVCRDAGSTVRLDVASGVRAAVVADALARILRCQGISVLLCYEDAAGADPAWAALGVTVADARQVADPSGTAGARGAVDPSAAAAGNAGSLPSSPVRPVPPVADPLPLGCAAGRWALLHSATHDRPVITEDHLVQRESNPLFRVRYACARTRALVRNAADLGFIPAPGDLDLPDGAIPTGTASRRAVPTDGGPPTHAAATSAFDLVTALAEYPRILAAAARHRAPDRLARHLVCLADAYLSFQATVRILPLGDEKPSAAHRARLALAEATGTVLAGGLTLLGIDAPDTI